MMIDEFNNDSLEDAAPDETALYKSVQTAALRLLARREYSSQELTRKLAARGHPIAVIKSVLAELTQSDWLNNTRFVTQRIQQRIGQGWGPLRIRQELLTLGIEKATIDVALPNMDDPCWIEIIQQLYRKRYGINPPTDARQWAKCMRFFMQRGFTAGVIQCGLRNGLIDDADN
ncbi:regulatory protein RecX [Thiospirillum jenense]|uniref:Regulatory protein RecX n=1 Tax=Thiospirillum jenense TaxID=1653858 RepID=A0A839HE68_9GAMM|nr:regulatory protein RecX [Thiospirillum jenense]MBB1125309.1 regulatory protein RecX [Thiospirillum jenense]